MICIVSQSDDGFTRLPVFSMHNNTGTNLLMYDMCEVSYGFEKFLTSADTCFSVRFGCSHKLVDLYSVIWYVRGTIS